MQFHVLAGLPRSGSTLVANVLAQHPDVHVSGTSPMAHAVEVLADVISASAEVQSDLVNVPGSAEAYTAMIRGAIVGRYAHVDEPVVVDKGRGWALHRLLLDQVMPGSVMLVTVRDPRDVVASIERQHRRTAQFNSPLARTLYESAELLMEPAGMIGGPCRLIEDMLRRKAMGVHFVRYESLVFQPERELRRVFEALGLAEFVPDVENVADAATDADGLYYGKYPHHDAVGAIKAPGHDWRDVMDAQLAGLIVGRYPLFAKTFGYGDEPDDDVPRPNRAARRGRQ